MWREFVLSGLVLQQLCRWAQLEYLPDMVQGKGYKVPAWSQKQHRLVGSPPNPESSFRERSPDLENSGVSWTPMEENSAV